MESLCLLRYVHIYDRGVEAEEPVRLQRQVNRLRREFEAIAAFRPLVWTPCPELWLRKSGVKNLQRDYHD